MTKNEAIQLAAQLGVELPNKQQADALWDIVRARGMDIGTDRTTGDWVVLDAQKNVVARLS